MKKFDKRKYEKEFINKYEAKNEYNKAKEQLIFTSNQQFNYKKVPRKRRIILISSILLLASIITFLSIILNLPKANNSLTYLKMEVVETNLKNNINPNILANIEGLLPEKEENELKYFAKPNSKILIAIYLNNPNNYEILSFSINDYKYQSYEFKDGSTGQIIYIEVPIGSISGIEEFYINSLKYIDDKEIKEAIYEGERTIEVGITYINLPKIVDVKLDVEETKCNISYNLVNNSIINSDTYYKAFIFKNNNLIAGIDLNINDNNININNLEMATSYNLIIGYAYDLFDSLGYRFIVLYNCSFTTKNGIFNVVANSSYNSVNIQYDKNNDVNVKGAKLYYKNELINEISGENISFNNLLANSEYDLIIYYSYVLNEKEISIRNFSSCRCGENDTFRKFTLFKRSDSKARSCGL